MRDRLERVRQTRGVPALVQASALPTLAGIAVALGLAFGASAQTANEAPNVPAAPSDAPQQPQQNATITTLTISGNTAFSARQLQRIIDINVSNWYSRGDTYSKARLASALANLRSFYISRGYLRFSVRDATTTSAPDGKTVAIRITVAEGPLYTLASVKLTGEADNLASTPGVAEALQRALPIGQPASRDGLEAAQRAIIAQLGYDGYPQASVFPRFTTNDTNARVALALEIKRGQPLVQANPVRRNEITPLASVPKQPPAPPSAKQPQTAQAERPPAQAEQPKTAKPEQSKTAQTQPAAPPTQPASGQTQQAEQPIDLNDQREITLRASAGYSSSDRVIAMAGARYVNGLGKGRDLAADLAGGKTYKAVRLSESDRWFTPGGTSRSTSFWFHSDQPFYYLNSSRFRTSGMGVTERFDIPITAADSAYIAPGVERDWLGVDGLTPQAYLNYINRYGSSLNVATLRAGWTHDMRNSVSLPTRGYIAQGDAELGVGNATYLKAYTSARYYHPLWGQTVFSLSGLGGFGQGLGSKGYPIQKYFYAGGVGSVRGYAANSLGSHDLGTDYPLGGRRLLVGSMEAITPLSPFNPDRPGRLVWLLFVDGGNVWDNGLGGTSAGSPRFSYGAGLGWQLPFGTFKLSFALPITRHTEDDYQRFQVEFNAGF